MNAADIQVKIEALLRQHGPFGKAAEEIAEWVYATFVEPTFTTAEVDGMGRDMLMRSFIYGATPTEKWEAEGRRCEGVFRELRNLLVTEEAKRVWLGAVLADLNSGERAGAAMGEADAVVQGYRQRTAGAD